MKSSIVNPKIRIWTPSQGNHWGKTVWIDRSVFEHKVYPNCKECKGKYVPIKPGDKLCLRCNYLKK